MTTRLEKLEDARFSAFEDYVTAPGATTLRRYVAATAAERYFYDSSVTPDAVAVDAARETTGNSEPLEAWAAVALERLKNGRAPARGL